jgi:3-methyladenine DNA glycosylase/8-oxoguanine DNA glycosylase
LSATGERAAAPRGSAATPRGRGPAPCVELRVEVRPPGPFRLPGGTPDSLIRRRGGSLQRWLHCGDEPVHVAAIQPARDRVIFGARAATREAAEEGIARLRFATGVDDDLRAFHDRFRDDAVIGRAVRANPQLRVRRKCRPWEALLAAITEQLIDFESAAAIQRRIIARLGRRCPETALRDAPAPAHVAAQAPALLASLDLAPKRALALRRCAIEVAEGRVDLDRHDYRRLLAIPEIGHWTIEMLALHGQGRMDLLPAGDLGYLKLVGRLRTGDPRARAEEAEVRAFFTRYEEWQGLAGEYMRVAAAQGLLGAPGVSDRSPGPGPGRPPRGRAPDRPGTRWSAPRRRSAHP